MKTKTFRIPGNNELTMEWANALGRFIQAFGMIEAITIEFVERMASPDRFKSLRKKFLPQRLGWIIDNVGERILSAEGSGEKSGAGQAGGDRAEAIIEALEEIRQLSYFRNVVTHGAIGLTLPENEEKGSPDIAGIQNFRPEDGEESELIPLEEVKDKTRELEVLSGKLVELLNEVEFAPVEIEE